MLEDAFAGFKAKVQALEAGIATLQVVNHTKTLQVVLKASMFSHAGIEGVLPGMAKRRMAEVMCQGNCLDQVLVQTQISGDRSPHLRDFQGMREARSEQISLMIQKHLGLVDQATEGRAVNNAVPITLVVGAVQGHRLLVTTTTAARWITGVWR